MDFDLRLKALARLAESTADTANAALEEEITKAGTVLETETQCDILEQRLGILNVIGHRASAKVVTILISFIHRLATLDITYSHQDRLLEAEVKRFHNATSLTVQAIEILVRLRYLEAKPILHTLIDLSLHKSEEIRKKALEGLRELATYQIDVIYGDSRQRGIGFAPQRLIVDELSLFDARALRQCFTAVLTLAGGVLTPTMEKTSWTYKSVTWSRGQVPGDSGLANIRQSTLALLKRVYPLAVDNAEKKAVLGSLREATRIQQIGETPEETIKMFARDTIEVLDFFRGLVSYEPLSIVQKIERDGFWIFYHAVSDEVAKAARDLEAEISRNTEYQTYKTLIGFEGIFGDWEELKSKQGHRDFNDEHRKEKAREFVSQITDSTFPMWRERILKFAETRSDDLATFPVFYYFLEQFAASQPRLAFELVSRDTQKIELFLIPLIRTLWTSSEKEPVKALVRKWTREGKYIYASIKQFVANEALDVEVLDTLLHRAIELNDVRSIALIMSVSVSNYNPEKKFLIDRFFLPALNALTERSNSDWIFDFWYRRETKALIQDLNGIEIEFVLQNLMHLKEIDYHAEEILYLVAEKAPERVLDFLIERLTRRARGPDGSLFDAVPFELHKLNKPLAQIPKYSVRAIRSKYDGDYGVLHFGGARLLHIIFPDFPKAFETALLDVIDTGEKIDVEFVLAVLRNYHGEHFIHRICREIVKLLPTDSSLRTEVAIALESTGVVTGEFGLAEAYEKKKEEIRNWMDDPDAKVRDFARWYISMLDNMIAAERKRAEEELALRKLRYGE